jgi:hypothetical protein
VSLSFFSSIGSTRDRLNAMKSPEYHEGPEALERFNKLATQVFRAPKTVAKDTPKSPKRKEKKSSKD